MSTIGLFDLVTLILIISIGISISYELYRSKKEAKGKTDLEIDVALLSTGIPLLRKKRDV